MGDKGTDVLTVVHKLVGLVWVVSAVAVLVLVVPASGSAVDWTRVGIFERVGGVASVVTFVIGCVYSVWKPWGFARRWVLVKWGLYLLAVSTAGYAMSATKAAAARTVVALTATQLVALLASMGVGVFLERSRHAPGREQGYAKS